LDDTDNETVIEAIPLSGQGTVSPAARSDMNQAIFEGVVTILTAHHRREA